MTACPRCGHALEYHGEHGCDVEVRDYGDMDCGCRYLIEATPTPRLPTSVTHEEREEMEWQRQQIERRFNE